MQMGADSFTSSFANQAQLVDRGKPKFNQALQPADEKRGG
jgi:hypothetical protein